jgi:hypothetical protein
MVQCVEINILIILVLILSLGAPLKAILCSKSGYFVMKDK